MGRRGDGPGPNKASWQIHARPFKCLNWGNSIDQSRAYILRSASSNNGDRGGEKDWVGVCKTHWPRIFAFLLIPIFPCQRCFPNHHSPPAFHCSRQTTWTTSSMMVLRASLYRIGWHCTRPRIRAFSRPTPARYLFSTTATQEPLTLSSDLTDSPIYVPSPPSAVNQLVHHSSSAPFLFYPAFLSSDEQAVLIHASLAKLDMSTSQSRDVRIRKDAWRKERNNTPYYGFLPDELYDFEEVMWGPPFHCPSRFTLGRVITME